MSKLRILKSDGWYEIHMAANDREPLFRLPLAGALFRRVLDNARGRFVFELRGLRLVDDRLFFYIKPADGLALPEILKWMKQTFTVRYNVRMGRTGHILRNRYWSVILEGEPPEGAEEWEAEEETEAEPPTRVRGRGKRRGPPL
jgi:hypothetical protein